MAKEADGSGRKGSATQDIEAPMIQAARRGLNSITGADTAWMGPSNPMQAIVPSIAGRQYDYPVAANLNIRPRAGEMVSFAELRALSDAYYLVRLAIETRKDQLSKLRWVIKPKDPKKKPDARCEELTKFFKKPDKRHSWQEWQRMIIEDVLAIDAPAVYYRENFGNKPYAFEIIDGATIKVLLDSQGRSPLPDEGPAYQQNIKGIPAVNYTSRELIYKPRNPRSHKAYGYGPVEQIIMIVNIGLRREMSQLQFYTEGNIPEALITTPNTWNPDQIKIFQAYWDSLFEGNTASRRHAKFVPGGMNVHETKAASLTDEFDEWLARVVQYCFSLPATAYVKQVNKGETTNMKEQAEEEGLAPIMLYMSDFINYMIAEYWPDYDDLEFSYEDEKSIDPLVQAQIDQIYITTDVVEKNEVRANLGLEARDYDAEALEKAKKLPGNDPKTGLPLPPVVPGATDNAAPPKAKPKADGDNTTKAGHNHGLKKKTYAKLSPTNVARSNKYAGKITKAFAKMQPGVIRQITKAYDKIEKGDFGFTLRKVDVMDGSFVLQKGTADDITDNLKLDFTAILNVSTKPLTEAAIEGIEKGNDYLDELNVPLTEEQLKALRDSAEGVGDYNAAELVKGLDDSTRNMLATDIDDALKDGLSTGQLAGKLEDSYAFSESRAETIARTEVAKADMAGSMKAYRESAHVNGKHVLLAEDPCPICEENANDGIIPLDDNFSSGDDASPFHPRCECDVAPDIIEDDETEGNEGD